MAFTPNELATLRALIDRIVPPDEYPSATGAGVDGFLVHLIELENLGATYRTGLAEIEAAARQCFDRGFAELSTAEQDAILTEIETAGTATSRFFSLLAEQTIEGYYADPNNGGNRDGIAWKMIGYQVTA